MVLFLSKEVVLLIFIALSNLITSAWFGLQTLGAMDMLSN
jgi:hypothetical protein